MPNLFPGEGKKLVDEPTDLKAAEATGASPFQPPTPNVSGSSEATAKSSPDFGLDSDDDSLSSSDDSVEPMDIDLDMEAFQLHSDQMKDTVSLSDRDDSVEPMDVDMVPAHCIFYQNLAAPKSTVQMKEVKTRTEWNSQNDLSKNVFYIGLSE
jgi:hypothetical protein